jgi:ribosomal protein L40E
MPVVADDCRNTSSRHLRLKKVEDSRREILLVEAP